MWQLAPLMLSCRIATSGLPASAIHTIAHGGIHVEPQWIPPELVAALRSDAQQLFAEGLFSPDGLTNTAVSKQKQGFSSRDRQTFRGDGWASPAGNRAARIDFADRMLALRKELASGLGRPTLASEGVRKHEMTYNWYEPGAKLGRHLDEHHEETKGTKGWLRPTRRSVTWLVYLNDQWALEEGGALRTFPRQTLATDAVGDDAGNLQIGWANGRRPIFCDSTREDGLSTLYCRQLDGDGRATGREVLSSAPFEVPRQPIDFSRFLQPQHRATFEQISTTRLDPRFASPGALSAGGGYAANAAGDVMPEFTELHHVDVPPVAGTLVVFDSVSLPHLVREVTGSRQRVAATGWFHEDSQQFLG